MGFTLDSFEINHVAASKFAKYAHIKVIMPLCRLAPEHPFLHGLNDAIAVTKYIFANTEQFKIDKHRIMIGGLSSGANFAAVVTNTLRQDPKYKIYHQLLISGIYDFTNTAHTYNKHEQENKLCPRKVIDFIAQQYIPKKYSLKNTKISPYWEKNLRNALPPTTIAYGEYDGVRNDSEGYAEKLIKAGNKIGKIIFKGQTHSTILLRKALFDGEDPALIIAKHLKGLKHRR